MQYQESLAEPTEDGWADWVSSPRMLYLRLGSWAVGAKRIGADHNENLGTVEGDWCAIVFHVPTNGQNGIKCESAPELGTALRLLLRSLRGITGSQRARAVVREAIRRVDPDDATYAEWRDFLDSKAEQSGST